MLDAREARSWSRLFATPRTALGAGLVVALLAFGCASPEERLDPAGAGAPTTTAAPEAEVAPARKQKTFRVARVVDGDTIDLADGRTVRLVQIDTPEASGECYGEEASAALGRLLPPGTRIRLERDPVLDDVDRFGRSLRYVYDERRNVNLALVEQGAAGVWFFDGDRGRYAEQLLAAARRARAAGRGAWGSCHAVLDPTGGFETRPRR